MTPVGFDPSLCRIRPEKIVRYLLDPASPEGGGKARVFAALGFRPGEWRLLEAALLAHARANPAAAAGANAWGAKFVVDGPLRGPGGATARVRTVWQVQADGVPYLVTAYPG